MATTSQAERDPWDVPERVAIETPRGDIRTGEVVDDWMDADADGIERWYVVEVAGSRYRRPADDVLPPDPQP